MDLKVVVVALGVKQGWMLPSFVRRSVGCCPEGYKDTMIQRSAACWLCAGERKEGRARSGGEGEFLQASPILFYWGIVHVWLR